MLSLAQFKRLIDILEGGIASKLISGWSYKKSSLTVQEVTEGEKKNNVLNSVQNRNNWLNLWRRVQDD